MNGNMIDFQGKIQQNHGLQTDYESGFGCFSSVYEFHQPMIHLRTNPQNYTAVESSSPIINRFRSPESAFFAAERFMGIPPMSFQAVAETGLIDFREEDTLQSVVKPRIFANQSHRSIDKPFELSSRNVHGGNLFEINSQKTQPPRLSPATTSSSCSVYSSSKTRIRWTQDLHEKFVDCVNYLGGAEKATPKAILKLMDSQGLTILHVKSHLQKYRIAKYIPDSAEGRSERRSAGNEEPGFDMKTGQQIKEALQLQLHVQRRLHEQLEIQKRLQLQIEEQGRRLKMMFEEQQKTSHVLDSRSPHSFSSNST